MRALILPLLLVSSAALAVPATKVEAHGPVAEKVTSPQVHFSPLARFEVRVRDYETRVLEKIEPKNTTGLNGKKPTIANAALNILETAAVRVGLMRPEKTYNAWVDQGELMRGSEQDQAGYAKLKADGIRTVINLRRESNTEAPMVEALGMKAIQIPMYDQSLPSPKEVQKFFSVVDDKANGPVYIHCEQGVGRTGLMVALYRIHHDGVSADTAISEAKTMGMSSESQFQYIRDFAAASARGAPWATVQR
jgi:protein tyrosine phosphatase (PTP) superfamily phosphohydrolase (DUF442 family)